MAIVLIALLIVILLGGLGFALHVLWWLALAALVIWLLGFLIRVGEGSSRRWYRW
ncbi:MAG TPA: hydrophobic protein [Streptosporangiaceae bacterium]|nr:hydrophobic protein [Streptosporangiaceae bacterium]